MASVNSRRHINILGIKLAAMIACILVAAVFMWSNCYADEIDEVKETEYVFSEVEDRIYNTLRAAGYTRAGACGILGNMAVENSQFNPDLYGSGGITYGLFQWNNVGERMENLTKWCNNRKLYPNRVDGQLAFALHELDGGDPIAKRAKDYLMETDKPRVAAMEFTVGFERCVGSSLHPENDAKYDGFIYPEYFGRTYQALGKRMDMAEKYYDGYVTDAINPALIYETDAIPTPGIVSEVEEQILFDIQRSINMAIDPTMAEDKTFTFAMRVACLAIGYLCGCIYLSLLLVDRKKLKANRMNKIKQIPHASSVFTRMGTFKASMFFANDIAKLGLAIAIATVFINGLTLDEKILYTGLGVVLGNAYPFWNKFSGGIGYSVSMLTLIYFMPIWGVLCFVIGMFFAYILKSLSLGVIIMSFLMIPFAYHYKSTHAAVIVGLIMLTLIISHQRILLKYIDRNVLKSYYAERRRQLKRA